jgi:L-cystine uptake protein TcyP (sodium:dicarboxylate symporter family)
MKNILLDDEEYENKVKELTDNVNELISKLSLITTTPYGINCHLKAINIGLELDNLIEFIEESEV